MNNIRLRNLLNLTEQAPQPIQVAKSPTQNPTDNQPQPTALPSDNAPSPDDPSEYDFTRDFRSFEDEKNKAEAAAKKKFLDKMNKTILNKKIVANASRGYGQPKTDYTVENVKKISVEFWYKDWVVIVTDDNDKKYFLTPGINIKIEQPSAGAEPGSTQTQAPEAPANVPIPDKADDVAPDKIAGGNTNSTSNAPEEVPNAATDKQAAPVQTPADSSDPAPTTEPKPNQQPVQNEIPPTDDDKTIPVDFKKRKLAMAAESVSKLMEQYISKKELQPFLNECCFSDNGFSVEIPNKKLSGFDVRDFMLEVRDLSNNYKKFGKKVNVDIQRIGLNYQFKFQII